LKYYENIPLIGLVSRLDDQKGLDFIAAIIDEMMRLNLQFIVLGTGEEKYHILLNQIKARYPEKISVNIKFDNKLAHNIYAGSDMFLMPSRFEPCGLGQMISLKYGTVPIVRETGGLADTVTQYNFKTKQGNGFVFSGYDPYALLYAIKIAVDTYKNKTVWERLQLNGMKANFSWDESAKEYVEIYKKAMDKYNKIL
jgi:starch synthase